MYRYFWQLLSIVLIVMSCKSNTPKIEMVETKNKDGYTERYQRRMNDYAKEGLYVKIDPQGKKVEEAMYKGDTLDGYRMLYYENGDTQVVESYRKGKFEGAYKVYYPGGKVKLVGQYVNNEMTGKWNGFYPGGALKEVVTFAHNEENGPFTEYYENGNLKAEGAYLNGDREQGELKLYDETGKHIKTMMCDKGVCNTIWEADKSGN